MPGPVAPPARIPFYHLDPSPGTPAISYNLPEPRVYHARHFIEITLDGMEHDWFQPIIEPMHQVPDTPGSIKRDDAVALGRNPNYALADNKSGLLGQAKSQGQNSTGLMAEKSIQLPYRKAFTGTIGLRAVPARTLGSGSETRAAPHRLHGWPSRRSAVRGHVPDCVKPAARN
jgi:hypothetical protein